MKRSALMVAALCLLLSVGGQAKAASILLTIDDSSGNLGTVDVVSGAVQFIDPTAVSLTDIAYSPTGTLFGIDATNLWTFSSTTGFVTALIGPTNVPGENALVFGTNGLLYTAGSSNNDIYIVNPATGVSTDITPSGTGIARSAGDLAFVGTTLYESSSTNDLIKITLNAAGTSVVSETDVGPFGFSSVLGMAEGSNGVLYGVSGTQIFSINLTTGQGTLILNYGGKGLGPAFGTTFFTEAVSAVPEPSSLTLGGIATIGLLGYAWRRRRQAV